MKKLAYNICLYLIIPYTNAYNDFKKEMIKQSESKIEKNS